MKEHVVKVLQSASKSSINVGTKVNGTFFGNFMRIIMAVILIFCSLFVFLAAPSQAGAACAPGVIGVCDDQFAAVFGSFNTISYNLSRINADEAYSLGYSGKGVTVGIIDSEYSTIHRELKGRSDGIKLYEFLEYHDEDHGVHVGGIIAASRAVLTDEFTDRYGSGMQGVAYEANIFTVATDPDEKFVDNFRFFIDKDDILIINNSWTDSLHELLEVYEPDGSISQDWIKYFSRFTNGIVPLLSKRDVLLVFSSGNEGGISPQNPSSLPSVANYFSDGHYFANNMITVLNYNSKYPTNSLLYMSPDSNMAFGASWYTLMAPGTNIVSTLDFDYGDITRLIYLYDMKSGTSMAAPHVSGAAALVQEAFPGIEGKQIGDILLSTATKVALERLPAFLIKDDIIYDANGNRPSTPRFLIYAPKKNESSLTTLFNDFKNGAEINNFLSEYYNGKYKSELLAALDPLSVTVLENEDYESLFGRGTLDAGKAVKGPGLLEAYRLTSSDLEDSIVYGLTRSILYPVYIKTGTWKWLNDIGEDQQFTDGNNYPVGIKKSGSGTLELSGNNTFSGDTFITEGTIRLADSGTILSPVTVELKGTLSGEGKLKGFAQINGTLYVGSSLSGNYATITFENGLHLNENAMLFFTLGSDALQSTPTAGIQYDSIRVSGGDLSAEGSLIIDAADADVGKYVLFDYDGATISEYNFKNSNITVSSWNGLYDIENDTTLKQIVLNLYYSLNQNARIWIGVGVNSSWETNAGRWSDGASWTNASGNIVEFLGSGEKISNIGEKDFESLTFGANGYEISGDALNINPENGTTGKISVLSGFTAIVNNPITGNGQKLEKVGTGRLVLGSSANSYSRGTTVTSGEIRLNNGNLPNGVVMVSSSGSLSGTGTITGPTTVHGTLSPGDGTNTGILSFESGLTLAGTSFTAFDLFGNGEAGVDFDLIEVLGGSLVLGGTLYIEAISSGIYTLIDFTGAKSYSGNFDIIETYVNGVRANGVIEVNDKTVTLSVSSDLESTRLWKGTGESSEWTVSSGKWTDVPEWVNKTGTVLTFSGVGEKITNIGVKDFDTIFFSSDGYTIEGSALNISSDTQNSGAIFVSPGNTAVVNSSITGSGQKLESIGAGVLILGSNANTYSGGTNVSAGELRLDNANIPNGVTMISS
ncbi:MAG: S8 family serine peptidase, partial [Deltaproteobacteria bacterium]|nr:S8 family serine peptidase [Deltaproteobacteria bacterium]